MTKLKEILKKLFFLPPWLTLLIAVPSLAFVFVMLSMGEQGFLTYFSYLLSAYALIILVTGFPRIVKGAKTGWENFPLLRKIRATSLGTRLLGDEFFRSEITLHGGLLVNVLYVALNLFSGLRYRTVWFVTLAFYYVVLSVMRTLLVRYVHRKSLGTDITAELRPYRLCGIMLLIMNEALVGIVVLMVTENRGFSYPGLLIYAMAAYTFYITISAIVNVVKYRRRGSPVLSAAKVISLTAALVSMLSLETAMIGQFDNNQDNFRTIMVSISGGAVCAVVLAMAIYMIVRATRQLRRETAPKTVRMPESEPDLYLSPPGGGSCHRNRKFQQEVLAMNENRDTFHFSYNARQQEEIREIREKYAPTPKSVDKMEQLRRLDASAVRPGKIISITVGVLSTLLMGFGMCCTMVWTQTMFIPGIIIGIVGIAGIIAAAPLYNYITKKQRQKLAPEILRLTDELSQ